MDQFRREALLELTFLAIAIPDAYRPALRQRVPKKARDVPLVDGNASKVRRDFAHKHFRFHGALWEILTRYRDTDAGYRGLPGIPGGRSTAFASK